MSLSDRMKARKKKRLIQKQAKLERKLITVTEEYLKLEGDTSGLEKPKTRMTDDYLEFLKQQEAAADKFQNSNEEL